MAWIPLKFCIRRLRSAQGFTALNTEEKDDQSKHGSSQNNSKSNYRMCLRRMVGNFTQRRSPDVHYPGSADIPDSEGGKEQCLTTVDLVSLGMGSACGIGMYLTSGIIAGHTAGLAGIISIFIGGIASLLTGLHYAELAGICPRTSGSAYFYTYVTIGELAAFLIGWGLIAEYIVCTAFGAVAASHVINSVTGNLLETHLYETMNRYGLPRIDFIAAFICFSFTWLLAVGVKMSTKFNNILNLINMAVLVVFVSVSCYLGSSRNWAESGFAPLGVQGVVRAIPIAYCAFIGFDAVATTGGECKDPVRSIPTSIILSNAFNIVIFVVVVAALTWDVPYNLIEAHTAMLDVFVQMGVAWLKYVIGVGAVSGLLAAVFGSMFPLPRILQSMAQDGLIFRYFSRICPKRQTAFRATIFTGGITIVLAGLADLTFILELTLISTLFTYVIVIMGALVARYVSLDHGKDNADVEAKPAWKSSDENLSTLENHNLFESTTPSLESRRSTSMSLYEKQPSTETTALCGRQRIRLAENKSRDLEQVLSPSQETLYSSTVNTSRPMNDVSMYEEAVREGARGKNLGMDNPSFVSEKNNSHIAPLADGFYPTISSKVGDIDPENLDKNVRRCRKGSSDTNLLTKTSGMLTSFYQTCVNLAQRHFLKCLIELYIGLFLLSFTIWYHLPRILELHWLAILFTFIALLIITSNSVMLFLLPPAENRHRDGFRSPLIPLVSVMTAGFNIFIMVTLEANTWGLFTVWMAVGLLVYFLYGTSRSAQVTGTAYEKVIIFDEDNDAMDDDRDNTTLHINK